MGKGNKATFSMHQVKEILKMHEETVFGFIKITAERFDTKLYKLMHEIHDGINRHNRHKRIDKRFDKSGARC